MRPAFKTLVAFVCVAIFAVASVSWAMEPAPLPALQLTGFDGQAVRTGDLPNKGNWLLIYLNPKSHFCDLMLKLMTKDQYPNLANSAVFVVGGTVDDAKALQAKYPDLATASWYADPNRDGFTQLKLHGVPAVIGISQQTMKWIVNGVTPDAGSFRVILNSWVGQ